MRIRLVVLSFFLFGLTVHSQDLEFAVLGIWNFENFNSKTSSSTFESGQKMKKNKGGYEFRNDGVVIVRTNSMGCVVIGKNGKSHSWLSDVEGVWKWIDENQIEIYFKTFGGENYLIGEIEDGKLRTTRKTTHSNE